MVGTTPLRGRDGQFDAVLARLARLRSGIGSVVVIEGGPGFGKTRLLRETFAAAIDLGIRGGHGMADPLDRIVELAPLLEALFQNDPPLFDRRLLSDQHAAPEQRFWLLQDIEALLERAAMDEPLLLCLDDLHWADNGTAAALRLLPKRLAGLPIAWFLSTRPGQGSPQMDAALAELAADGATRIVLDALSDEAVEQVVTDLLAARPDEALLRAVERTRGNPFLLSSWSAAWPRSASSPWCPGARVSPRIGCRHGRAVICASVWRGCRRSRSAWRSRPLRSGEGSRWAILQG